VRAKDGMEWVEGVESCFSMQIFDITSRNLTLLHYTALLQLALFCLVHSVNNSSFTLVALQPFI